MPVSSYFILYPIVVAILTVFTLSTLKFHHFIEEKSNVKYNSVPGLIVALVFAIFVGLRPLSAKFVDMINYSQVYYALNYGREFKGFNFDANYISDNVFAWMGANYYEVGAFFLLMSLIYFVITYFAMTKIFRQYAFLGFITFLGAFSTFSYATNGIRAGAAAAFFLLAIGYFSCKWKGALCLFISLGLHHAMILPIIAYIAVWLFSRPKAYFVFWLVCVCISFLHITFFQQIFASLSDESGATYLSSIDTDWGGKVGFRLDFILYSCFPIVIGYYAIFKRRLTSRLYSFMLSLYMLINAVWMLCMYAAFTNRIAYLSWLMYPVLIVYPFVCKNFMPNQRLWLVIVVLIQFIFTVLIGFI